MTGPTTREQYAAFATRQPQKARHYRASITETLKRTNIHEIERERLTDALAGIADALGEEVLCSRCGAVLSDPESKAKRLGPECSQRMAMAS